MKYLIFFLTFFLLINCSNSKKVFWCGDHPCINNKEKEAYFKQTMIVEIREIGKKKEKKLSEIEKIKKSAGLNNENTTLEIEKIANENQINDKEKLKIEKRLAKEKLLEQKKKN